MAQHVAVNIWLPEIQTRKEDVHDFVTLCECVPKMKCRHISVLITADPEHLTLVINLYVSHINKVAFL